ALRAAMTGHLVFSTLHTNDAVSAIPRLIDIGVPPYLIASSLLGVLAQRLVRKICPHCKVPYEPSESDMKYLPLPSQWRGTLYKGRGCPKCFHTGYSGRTVIAEVLEVDDSLRNLFTGNVSSEELLRAAKKKGFRTMFWDGLDKVLEGKTTLQELMRVVILPQEETPVPKLEEKSEPLPVSTPSPRGTPPPEIIPRGSLTHLFQKILNLIPEIEGIFCYDSRIELLDYARFSEELPHPSERLEKDLKNLLASCPDFSQGFLSNKNHLIFLWRSPTKKTLLLFTLPSKHYSRAFLIDALNQVLSGEKL
ncbi:MAG: GspE/PulE family protein, partial [bacterium]